MEVKAYDFKSDCLYLLDQRKLPHKEEYFICESYQDVYFAIQEMVTRGAPLIGAAAAYGVVLACKEYKNQSLEKFFSHLNKAFDDLAQSRPTAVNLFWALEKMEKVLYQKKDEKADQGTIYWAAKEAADKIASDEAKTCEEMAKIGDSVIGTGDKILTHCNTGALATTGIGTALGVIRKAHYSNKHIQVYVDETRPRLQGSKLTCWELQKEAIPYRLIPDSAAAALIRDEVVDLILVGADRVSANGDVANKIGTFMLSVLAKTYNIPFYVVAPVSTIDFNIEQGSDITIEERKSEEVTKIDGISLAPNGAGVYNPAFDVTPAENITGIITQYGIITPRRANILPLQMKQA